MKKWNNYNDYNTKCYEKKKKKIILSAKHRHAWDCCVSRATIRPSASSQVQQAVSTYYFKLPYVGSFTRETEKRLRKLVQRYCTSIEIKLTFSSFKVGSMLSVKDPVPLDLHSHAVYKFSCAGCNGCYRGEISRNLSTCIHEHLSRDRNLHVYQHLQES